MRKSRTDSFAAFSAVAAVAAKGVEKEEQMKAVADSSCSVPGEEGTGTGGVVAPLQAHQAPLLGERRVGGGREAFEGHC